MTTTICICGTGFVGTELFNCFSQIPDLKVFHAPKLFEKPYGLSPAQREAMREFMNSIQPDCIINVAGPTDIQESFSESEKYRLLQLQQVQQHMTILSSCPATPKYIYLSSGSVYGSTTMSGATELDPTRPDRKSVV